VPELANLGWTPALGAAFAPHEAKGLAPGRVSLEHNHVYRVLTSGGEWLAEASGRIKYLASGRHELPAVGDWVAVRPDPRGGRAHIKAILPRRSWFSRKAAGRGAVEQVVAANIDTVLLVFGLDMWIKPRAIERYLLLSRQSGVRPVVVLNKSDVSAEATAAGVAAARSVAGGAPIHAVSARTGAGIDDLRHYLVRGQTLALLGPSGAGKSSLANSLVGQALLPTGEVRPWDARGRHTSVHRELVLAASGGVLIDTPGMRELQLWDQDEDGALAETFADLAELATACRFRDCRHDREPGCAVKAAVEAGRIDAGRYASYLKLQQERQALDERRDERAQLEAKRTTKIQHKALKAMQKIRGR
jgi:ribosome biogenesis GTPase